MSDTPSPSVWAIGLMTGTALDGNIDIAAVRTDGTSIAELGPWTLARYPDAVRDMLPEAAAAARRWRFEGPEPAIFAAAEAALTRAQADAVAAFVAAHDLEPALVGFHGQTVAHRAPGRGLPGRTRQLGDGPAMARRLALDVVWDFRSADVAAGGQGAPLAPSYHAALMRRSGLGVECAVLNLGGVANLTWCDAAGGLHAFDTGPANAPIDDWVRRHGLGDFDRDGRVAASGRPDETRLSRLLDHAYLRAPYPKSLDRDDFTAAMADGLGVADGAATLTAFTAGAVAHGLERLPGRVTRLVVCGGGRHNPTLMAALAARTGCRVEPCEAVGWRGDAVEAECFAYLAVRARRGLPLGFPLTTGVARPTTGGRLAEWRAVSHSP